MAEKHATLSVGDDLAGEVWEERPILPAPEVWVLDVKYAGETVAEKLARLRTAMKKEHATVHILSTLTMWHGCLISAKIRRRKCTGTGIHPDHRG